MNKTLAILRIKYMNEYLKYRSGVQTLEEYYECLRPLDETLHTLELQNINNPLEGIPILRKSSSAPSFMKKGL